VFFAVLEVLVRQVEERDLEPPLLVLLGGLRLFLKDLRVLLGHLQELVYSSVLLADVAYEEDEVEGIGRGLRTASLVRPVVLLPFEKWYDNFLFNKRSGKFKLELLMVSFLKAAWLEMASYARLHYPETSCQYVHLSPEELKNHWTSKCSCCSNVSVYKKYPGEEEEPRRRIYNQCFFCEEHVCCLCIRTNIVRDIAELEKLSPVQIARGEAEGYKKIVLACKKCEEADQLLRYEQYCEDYFGRLQAKLLHAHGISTRGEEEGEKKE
jgi:hypothetical protein